MADRSRGASVAGVLRRPVALFLGALLLLFCPLAVFPPPGFATTGDEDRAALMQVDFSCIDGSREKLERWGRQGYSRACYRDGVQEGRIIFWEEGYMNLEGYYRQGKKDGVWTVFNIDGTVYMKITFEDGEKGEKKLYNVPWK